MSSNGNRLREMARRAEREGGQAAALAMAKAGRDEIRRTLARRSHAPRTPTPSPPGQPPAKISGRLRDKVTVTSARQIGAGRWMAAAGPDGVVYARIQELGGVTGRNHMTVIPPRPYMRPAVREVRESGRATEAAVAAFWRAVHGR
ncbi:hypothetical protein [Actinomadura hibisca]|uniref:hypothetical protein n=1 Tax=Actinomadura hibisca TaxID=68565 RepID=UPI00082F406B|nr:hypothetical protein [Actinomadura hibisca]